MRILAIETATSTGSVALLDGGRVVAERSEQVPQRHLEWLAPTIAHLLREAGWVPARVEGVAVSTGPGSFTSLRIGMATALMWSRARDLPIVGIPTLAVVAASAGAEGLVAPLLDVRRREVAGALYHRVDGRLTPVLEEAAGPLDRILRRLPGGAVTVTGDALARYREDILQIRPDAILAPPSRWSPTAAALGALAWERLRQGERDDRYQLRPVYVRTPVDEG